MFRPIAHPPLRSGGPGVELCCGKRFLPIFRIFLFLEPHVILFLIFQIQIEFKLKLKL